MRIAGAPKCASTPHVVCALRYGSKSRRRLPSNSTRANCNPLPGPPVVLHPQNPARLQASKATPWRAPPKTIRGSVSCTVVGRSCHSGRGLPQSSQFVPPLCLRVTVEEQSWLHRKPSLPARSFKMKARFLAPLLFLLACEPEIVPPDTPMPTAISLQPDSYRFEALGATVQLNVVVTDQEGKPMEGLAVTWSSSDTTVAVVSAAGVVSAVRNTPYTNTPNYVEPIKVPTEITATAGSLTDYAEITVTQIVTEVVMSPPADTVVPGVFVELVATAFGRQRASSTGGRCPCSGCRVAMGHRSTRRVLRLGVEQSSGGGS